MRYHRNMFDKRKVQLDPALSFGHGSNDVTLSRKIWRPMVTRKSCMFVFLAICCVAVTYLILLSPKSGSFSIFRVTQNVYVGSQENKSGIQLIPKEDYYSIVFDAGSTGTRIHIIHFKKDDDGNLEIVKDIFKKVKPGLSSYADEPDKAVESVRKLLGMAKDYIPEEKWSKTPIILKATAGLRLLPGTKAEVILEGVRKLFMSSLFQKLGDDFVSIMDGDSEGIYGWLTVSYLSGKLSPKDINKMYGALDLGGGSVQITLPMDDKDLATTQIPQSYLKSVDISLNSYSLYTHSYLGLGLMSARASILNESAVHQEGTPTTSEKSISISSPCFPDGFKDVWKFAGHSFEIRGTDQCSFENCRDFAKRVILSKKINRAAQINKMNIFAFSYFFDRATELDLIDESSGGEILVQNYIVAAQTVCQRGSVTEKPFLCLDATYISTLLTDGFGLGLHHKLMLKRTINDFDVSWAVGAALDLYEKARTSH